MVIADLTLRLKTEGRTVARKLGLLRPLRSVRAVIAKVARRDGYERAFDDALRAEVRSGDVIWDVGANLGFYTRMFSERTGPSGLVCAFEPFPACFEELRRRCDGRFNVRFFDVALGDREAKLPMWMGAAPLGSTHSLVEVAARNASQATIGVRVARGDALIISESVPTPNVIKVDVEGFEEEVLLGLQQAISHPGCRGVFVEVHFAILERRGARHAPARIQRFLVERGFRVDWTDASHLAARKSHLLNAANRAG